MNKDLYLDVLEHQALLFMTGNNITISMQDNAPCHITKCSDLEREIKELWDEVDCIMLEKPSQSMLRRIAAVIDSRGDL